MHKSRIATVHPCGDGPVVHQLPAYLLGCMQCQQLVGCMHYNVLTQKLDRRGAQQLT